MTSELEERHLHNADLNHGHDAPVPEGYRHLEVSEKIHRGDLYWARDWDLQECMVVPDWSAASGPVIGTVLHAKAVAYLRKIEEFKDGENSHEDDRDPDSG